MKLRKADIREFDNVKDFYWDLIDKMKDRSNTVGWKKGIYPADDFLRESLENGELYVIDGEDGIIASVVLNSLWNDGYDGLPWSTDCANEEVLVPHALGVKPDVQGRGTGKAVVRDIIDMAKASGRKTVRLDILGGNAAAERLYTQAGFRYVQAKTMFYEDTGWTEYIMYERVL